MESNAPSCLAPSMELPKAGINIFSISWCVSLPPPPCARSTFGYCSIGMGHINALPFFDSDAMDSVRRPFAIVIVSRACALGRDHCGPHRAFGCAPAAKCRAFMRLPDPLQDQSAHAFRGLVGSTVGDAEAGLRVELRVLFL